MPTMSPEAVWLLTPAEIEQAVKEWVDQDWSTRTISLNRGHHEGIAMAIAQAQLRKVLKVLGSPPLHVSTREWENMKRESGSEL